MCSHEGRKQQLPYAGEVIFVPKKYNTGNLIVNRRVTLLSNKYCKYLYKEHSLPT
jgi:hypothetical protein